MPIANTAYIKDSVRCFGPLFFSGEIYSFYINTSKPISDPDFNNFQLNIRKLGNTAFTLTNIGTLVKDVYHNNFYKIWCSFTFPDIQFGTYELCIYDKVNNVLKVTSNPIIVEEANRSLNISRIFYRNSENIHGFNYEGLPDFYNIFTLPLIQIDFGFDLDRKQYRNVSDNGLRNYNVRKDKVFKIESYYFNEFGHIAMSSVWDDHNTIFLNKTFVIPKTPYSVGNGQNSMLSKGTVDVIADGSKINPNANLIASEPGDLILGSFLLEGGGAMLLETGDLLLTEIP